MKLTSAPPACETRPVWEECSACMEDTASVAGQTKLAKAFSLGPPWGGGVGAGLEAHSSCLRHRAPQNKAGVGRAFRPAGEEAGSGLGSRLETLARRCLWLRSVALALASGRRSSTWRSAEEQPEGVGGAVDVLVAAAEAPLEQLDAKHEAAHVRRHACTDWRRAPEDGRRRRRSSGFRRSTHNNSENKPTTERFRSGAR